MELILLIVKSVRSGRGTNTRLEPISQWNGLCKSGSHSESLCGGQTEQGSNLVERIVHIGSPSEGLGEGQTQPSWNLLVSGMDCAHRKFIQKVRVGNKRNQVGTY